MINKSILICPLVFLHGNKEFCSLNIGDLGDDSILNFYFKEDKEERILPSHQFYLVF